MSRASSFVHFDLYDAFHWQLWAAQDARKGAVDALALPPSSCSPTPATPGIWQEHPTPACTPTATLDAGYTSSPLVVQPRTDGLAGGMGDVALAGLLPSAPAEIEFESEFILFADQEPHPPRPPFRDEGFEDLAHARVLHRPAQQQQPTPVASGPPVLSRAGLATTLPPETISARSAYPVDYQPLVAGDSPQWLRSSAPVRAARHHFSHPPPSPAPILSSLLVFDSTTPAVRRPISRGMQQHAFLTSVHAPSPFVRSPAFIDSPRHRPAVPPQPPFALAQDVQRAPSALAGITAPQVGDLAWPGYDVGEWPFLPATRWPTPALRDDGRHGGWGAPQEGWADERQPPQGASEEDEEEVEGHPRTLMSQVLDGGGGVETARPNRIISFSSPLWERSPASEDVDDASGSADAADGSTSSADDDEVRALVLADLPHRRTRSSSSAAAAAVGRPISTGRATSSVRLQPSSANGSPFGFCSPDGRQPSTPPPSTTAAGLSAIDWKTVLTPRRKTAGKRALSPSAASSAAADDDEQDDEILTSSSPELETDEPATTPALALPPPPPPPPPPGSSSSRLRRAALASAGQSGSKKPPPTTTTTRTGKRQRSTSGGGGASATRGTLSAQASEVLTAWWDANRAAPYPTAEQKTAWVAALPVTRTQVDDFFINRRRRAKAKGATGGAAKPAKNGSGGGRSRSRVR